MLPPKESVDDFLEKVDDVQRQVQDLIDGKVDPSQFDKDQAEKERIEKAKLEVKEREAREKLLKGRPGKGHKNEYERFCRMCFREFMVVVDQCTICGAETITREERLEELKAKLHAY